MKWQQCLLYLIIGLAVTTFPYPFQKIIEHNALNIHKTPTLVPRPQQAPLTKNLHKITSTLKDITHAPSIEPYYSQFRQVFHIIETQYVNERRIKIENLLVSGLQFLKNDTIEWSISYENFSKNSIELCEREEGKFSFCQKRNEILSYTLAKPTFLIKIDNEVFALNLKNKKNLNEISGSLSYLIAKIHEKTQKTVLQSFINGVLTSLDPHSYYLSQSEYQNLKNSTQGNFFGIGITATYNGNFPIIQDVAPYSPAFFAQLYQGDIILKINNMNTLFISEESFNNIIKSLSENKDESSVVVFRPSEKKVIATVLKKKDFPSTTVIAKRYAKYGNVIFMRINNFSDKTTEEVWKNYTKIKAHNKIKALVIDLRGNPGGLLDEAIELANLFLRKGKILSIQSRYETQEEFATSTGYKIDEPVVLIVDASTASAAEIFAASLIANNRAVTIGETTYGKGNIQSVFETNDKSAMKLTVAYYYAANGKSLQNRGITPHVKISLLRPLPFGILSVGDSETQREKDLPVTLETPDEKDSTQEYPLINVWFPIRNEISYSSDFYNFSYPSFPNNYDNKENPLDYTTEFALDLATQIPIYPEALKTLSKKWEEKALQDLQYHADYHALINFITQQNSFWITQRKSDKKFIISQKNPSENGILQNFLENSDGEILYYKDNRYILSQTIHKSKTSPVNYKIINKKNNIECQNNTCFKNIEFDLILSYQEKTRIKFVNFLDNTVAFKYKYISQEPNKEVLSLQIKYPQNHFAGTIGGVLFKDNTLVDKFIVFSDTSYEQEQKSLKSKELSAKSD